MDRYMSELYHTPQDDMTQGLDFEATALLARLHFLVGYRIAQTARKTRVASR